MYYNCYHITVFAGRRPRERHLLTLCNPYQLWIDIGEWKTRRKW